MNNSWYTGIFIAYCIIALIHAMFLYVIFENDPNKRLSTKDIFCLSLGWLFMYIIAAILYIYDYCKGTKNEEK